MSAVVRVHGVDATLEDGVWSCSAAPMLDSFLNMRDPDGHGGSDPNPELTEAKRVVELFGGEIVRCDTPAFDPKAIY
jgi:hypothetical protein